MNSENAKQDNGTEDIFTKIAELPYPKEFLEKYDIVRLLSEKNGTETFLARGKSGGGKYVVKCYDSSARSFTCENEILGGLSHKGLPVYTDYYSSEKVLISVREYIEGKPLDLFAVSHTLPETQVISLISQLCDILTYLHGRPEPIIHRDIKPNNIIVKPDGNIVLIDFDIARKYRDNAERDTGLLATPGYAPPEQYGFSQTDTRSDIYSMGVLLRWLLTGSEKPPEGDTSSGTDGVSARMRRIIDKCTAFSPGDRYASAAEVKNALAHIKSGSAKSAVIHVICSVICLLMFGAGLLCGRNLPRPGPADIPTAVSASEAAVQEDAIVFREPLIEQSVRMQVGKTGGETLTQADLLSVTGVYVIGGTAYGSFDEAMSVSRDGAFGPMTTLEDIRMLPRLNTVIVKRENISDISPLSGMLTLKRVEIVFNPVSDASPLADLRYLEELSLEGTLVTDLRVLDGLPFLNRLDLTETYIPLENIGGRATVRTLILTFYRFESFEGLVGFDRLEELGLGYCVMSEDCSAEPLLELPSLRVIYTTPELAEKLEKVFGSTGAEVIVQ